jgi:hypothetical protein
MVSPKRRGWRGREGRWALALVACAVAGCRHEPSTAAPGAGAASPKSSGPDRPAAPPTARKAPAAAPKSERPPTIRFRDVSDATGIDFVHTSGNSPEKYYPSANGSGVAMIDYDGDGWLDLYFVTTRELPLDAPSKSSGNKLYRNRRDGTFEDVTERARVGFKGFCHGVAVGDVDNDGHPDLFLTNLGPNVLYINNGDGTFRDASKGAGLEGPAWSSGAAFLDYDRDGDLDLYVTSYGRWSVNEPHPFCGDAERKVRTYCSPLMIPPLRHYLYRNRGDGTFEDVTEAAGVLRRDGRGLGVVAADVDWDGLIDLFVANDLCPNFLFINKGNGTFADSGELSGAACSADGENQAGMGVDVEDVDGDGRPDLFVTHFRNEHNTLYRNLGRRMFQDASGPAGVREESMADVGWGCGLADLDDDGWPDMFVVNGHVDDNLDQLGQDIPQAEPTKVWRNKGRGQFRIVYDPGPFFAKNHVARGAAFGDLDNDGDVDVVINHLGGRPAVLRNESTPAHWIRLELSGRRSNRSAIGARVEVHAGGRTIRRQVKGGGSYLSAGDTRPLIGLGSAESVDSIDILWPGGLRSTLKSPKVDTTHRVREPADSP